MRTVFGNKQKEWKVTQKLWKASWTLLSSTLPSALQVYTETQLQRKTEDSNEQIQHATSAETDTESGSRQFREHIQWDWCHQPSQCGRVLYIRLQKERPTRWLEGCIYTLLRNVLWRGSPCQSWSDPNPAQSGLQRIESLISSVFLFHFHSAFESVREVSSA